MQGWTKRLFGGLMGLIFCLTLTLPVCAQNEGNAWAAVQEQQAQVYLQGASPDGEFTCQIGSTPVTPSAVTGISDLDTPLQTVIVVDNSVSIPSAQRPLVNEILSNVAGNRMDGEQFSVATIAQTVTWLCEGQTDYLALKQALDGITYNDQETRLTDCLYEVLTHLQQQYPGQLCRVVLVTDGVDNQEIGYTADELDALIRKTGYPIYAVGCSNSGANGNAELQRLFALTRLTGGQSFYLAETQDATAIAGGIAAWNTGVRLTIDLPAELCDGSQRQMQVVAGETTYTLSLTMPFATVAASSQPEEAPEATPEPAPGPEPEPEPEEQPAGFVFQPWMAAAAGGGVLLVVVIVVVIVLVTRRRSTSGSGGQGGTSDVGPTEIPEDDIPRGPGEPRDTVQLRLTDVNNPARQYQSQLQPGYVLSLGRDPARCQIIIDFEPSVSRHQCDLYLQDGEVHLRNTSQANITHVNGQRIEGDCIVSSGSSIKMGRLVMRLEYRANDAAYLPV